MNASDKLKRLIAARHKLAQLVLIDSAYSPVFRRIESEIASLEADRDLISRARAVAEGYRATG
jgi:hypothetical protein